MKTYSKPKEYCYFRGPTMRLGIRVGIRLGIVI